MEAGLFIRQFILLSAKMKIQFPQNSCLELLEIQVPACACQMACKIGGTPIAI